jgi:hypothetical protein
VVAGKGDVTPRVAGGDDPPPGVDCDRVGAVVTAPEVGGHLAVVGERAVEAAIRTVPGEREAPLVEPRHYDPSLAVDRHRLRSAEAREPRPRLAVASKGTIKAAVGLVTGEREAVEVTAGAPDGDDPPSGADRDRAGSIAFPEVGRHLAAGAEGVVEAAVGCVPGEREVEVDARVSLAGGDDSILRVDGHRVGVVGKAPEIGRQLAIARKGRVEAAVGCVAGEREGEVVPRRIREAYGARDHDPPLGVDRDRVGGVVATEVRYHLAAGAKRRIQRAAPPIASEREAAAPA